MANICVVLGIALFFVGKDLDNKDSQKKYTLDLVRDFQSDEQVRHRYVLLKPWLTDAANTLLQNSPDDRMLGDFIRTSLAAMSEQERDAFVGAVIATVDSYDTFLLCREVGQCDPFLLDRYLLPYATRFVCLYTYYIDQSRKTLSDDFARSLTDYVDRNGGCDAL